MKKFAYLMIVLMAISCVSGNSRDNNDSKDVPEDKYVKHERDNYRYF